MKTSSKYNDCKSDTWIKRTQNRVFIIEKMSSRELTLEFEVEMLVLRI